MMESAAGAENPHAVEVWPVWLNAAPSSVEAFRALLSGGELIRAQRFKFPALSAAFIQTRAALRILAARRLNADPCKLEISTGTHGKPHIEAFPGFGFNLSHSGNLAVFAFVSGAHVGVDVEELRGLNDCDILVNRYFSELEKREYRSLAPDLQQQAFFNAWTRKEAFVKATGEGLSLSLSAFSVSLTPGAPVSIAVPPDRAMNENWQLENLAIHTGYAAALAYSGHRRAIAAHPLLDMDSLAANPSL
jgi:4'-phosphopantetheinyl transferase